MYQLTTVYDLTDENISPYTEVRRVDVEHTENDDIIYNKFMNKVKDKRKITGKEFDEIFDNEIKKQISNAHYDVYCRICWEHGWEFRAGRIEGKRFDYVIKI